MWSKLVLGSGVWVDSAKSLQGDRTAVSGRNGWANLKDGLAYRKPGNI